MEVVRARTGCIRAFRLLEPPAHTSLFTMSITWSLHHPPPLPSRGGFCQTCRGGV